MDIPNGEDSRFKMSRFQRSPLEFLLGRLSQKINGIKRMPLHLPAAHNITVLVLSHPSDCDTTTLNTSSLLLPRIHLLVGGYLCVCTVVLIRSRFTLVRRPIAGHFGRLHLHSNPSRPSQLVAGEQCILTIRVMIIVLVCLVPAGCWLSASITSIGADCSERSYGLLASLLVESLLYCDVGCLSITTISMGQNTSDSAGTNTRRSLPYSCDGHHSHLLRLWRSRVLVVSASINVRINTYSHSFITSFILIISIRQSFTT